MPPEPSLDLGCLGLDAGGHLLVSRALARLSPGANLRVVGADPHLRVHLPAWARSRGHAVVLDGDALVVTRGNADSARLVGAVRAGRADQAVDHPPRSWGLAPRGALVEAGGPVADHILLDDRRDVWTDLAPKLYAQALAGQWDPETAVDWKVPALDDEVEDSVVQVMTFLIENEQAALTVPARVLGRIHPHFREVVQFLATQVADEARHVEVFSRRAALSGRPLGVSGAGGRASLQTLVDQPDWPTASFLLSVLGEGTFLALLSFLERHAPDPVTARVVGLAARDEARHVAFALGHLGEHLAGDVALRDRLRAATERRRDALATTAGLAPGVHDALVVLAAGSWEPAAIAAGWRRVAELEAEMDEGRRRRLIRLGFSEREAAELSALHTRNFM